MELPSQICINFLRSNWNGLISKETPVGLKICHGVALVVPGIFAALYAAFSKVIESCLGYRVKPIENSPVAIPTANKTKEVAGQVLVPKTEAPAPQIPPPVVNVNPVNAGVNPPVKPPAPPKVNPPEKGVFSTANQYNKDAMSVDTIMGMAIAAALPKIVFSTANQYNKGAMSACTLASIAFAASSPKEQKHVAMENVFKLLESPLIQEFLNTKKVPANDGTFSDLPFDLDENRDKQILVKTNISLRECDAQSYSGMAFDNRVTYRQASMITAQDLRNGIQEWYNSEATGTILIVAGASIGLRKNNKEIELFEPHGETRILKELGLINADQERQFNAKSYVITLKDAKETAELIYRLHGEAIKCDPSPERQQQFDMAWYNANFLAAMLNPIGY